MNLSSSFDTFRSRYLVTYFKYFFRVSCPTLYHSSKQCNVEGKSEHFTNLLLQFLWLIRQDWPSRDATVQRLVSSTSSAGNKPSGDPPGKESVDDFSTIAWCLFLHPERAASAVSSWITPVSSSRKEERPLRGWDWKAGLHISWSKFSF